MPGPVTAWQEAFSSRVGPHGYSHGWIKMGEAAAKKPERVKNPKPFMVDVEDIGKLRSDLEPGMTVEERRQSKPRDSVQDQLDRAIAKHGWNPSPVAMWGDVLGDGHHTYAAAKERGIKWIPAVQLHASGPGIHPPVTSGRSEEPRRAQTWASRWAAGWSQRTPHTAEASTVHEPLGKPGGPGLFHHKGMQLPAYIQHVAHHLIGQGHDESRAIEMAIGIVRDWAEGHDGHGNRTHPDVQAAAAKAIAQWEALKARA